MKYIIYKITNLYNGKIYIGKHQTKDPNDNYMGSGKLLRYAIKKYGIESFKKDIIHIFDTEEEMNAKEAELVTEDFCLREDTYNLCVGGKGGFGYINQNQLYDVDKRKAVGKIAMKNIHSQYDLSALASCRAKRNWEKGVYDGLGFKSNPLCGANNYQSKSIIDEDGNIYNTIKELAIAKNIHRDSVARRIKRGIYKFMEGAGVGSPN